MSKRITEEKCKELYKKYHTPEHVIRHCKAVSETAVRIAEKMNENGYNFDIPLIKGAGLAHDVARTCEHHEIVGAEILEKEGYKDEAEIIRVHMRFDFHHFEDINETDLVCLADRLVKEDRYVGLDERIDYIIHKAGDKPERTARILSKKKETRAFMDKIEVVIGQTIDSIFLKGNDK